MCNERIQYSHSQTGYPLIVVALLILGVLGGFMKLVLETPDASAASLIFGMVFLVAVVMTFANLNIRVTSTKIRWRFGPGLFKGEIPLADVRDVSIVETSMIDGWGVRTTADGMVVNIAGNKAVALRTADDRVIRLGTNEPERLRAAVLAAKGVRTAGGA